MIFVVCRELELRDILDLLFQFTSVQQRVIQWEATVARQAPARLQSLARDAVVLRLCWCGHHQACHHTGSTSNIRDALDHSSSQMLLTPALFYTINILMV